MPRVPLWPVTRCDSRKIGSYAAKQIPVVDIHELAAGKLAALLARSASRDLFDANLLLREGNLDQQKLRLAFVVYGAMNRKDWRTVTLDDVFFDAKELANELVPVVRTEFLSQQKSKTWPEEMVQQCRQQLDVVLPMSAVELEFLDRLLEHGEIRPELISADQLLIERIAAHPQLQWKAINVKSYKGK